MRNGDQQPGATSPAPLTHASVTTGRDAFIGRVQEIADISTLLRRARLVSLVGVGGAGKTRLATEFATRAAAVYPDGVWMVELASLTSADLLPQTVASVIGVREQSGEDVLDTVVKTLRDKDSLLVVDNCEHLVDPSARLADHLLTGCPRLRVLTTSREALDLPGEAVLRVGHLSLPDDVDTASRAVQRSDAVQLFVDRARLLRPEFELTPATKPVVAEICVRLDGIPLAIELAARWVRVLSVEEILNRLDDRFDLLSRGPRTAASRHRSLRATIEWSHELLDERERVALHRLSVLAGDFTLDSASAVCGTTAQQTLELLADLDAKSLVVAVPGVMQRFRQLESIRLYARERLEQSGELEPTYERLLGWLTEVARSHYADQLLHTVDDDRPRVDNERDNLQQAVEWTREHGDERLSGLAAALAGTWRRQGHSAQVRKLLDAVLSATAEDNPDRSLALIENGWASVTAGEFEYARTLGEQARAIEDRPGGRPMVLARALTLLTVVYQACGAPEAGMDSAERCVDVLRPLGQPLDTAVCQHNLAFAAMALGDLDRAAALMDECLPVYLELADPVKQMETLHSAGSLALERGQLAAAGDYFRRGIEACPFATMHSVYPLEGLAIVAGLTGQPHRGLLLSAAIEAQLKRWRMRREPYWQRQVDSAMTTAREQLGAEATRESVDQGERMTLEQALAFALDEPLSEESESPLSQRERDVAALTAEGLTNKEIAVRLSISERTVESHLLHIRTKLDLRSRAQVAAWAVERS